MTKSRPPDDSSRGNASVGDGLQSVILSRADGEGSQATNSEILRFAQDDVSARLSAIAALWKKTHRVFEARFDGASMLPTIEPQQAVTVRCGEEVHRHDVVLALHEKGVVVHRVIWISVKNDWLLTRGDARTIADPPIAMDDVIGIVDAQAFTPNKKQRFVDQVVRTSAQLGRRAARLVVRTLQIASRLTQRVK
jgi:hypothetical protein